MSQSMLLNKIEEAYKHANSSILKVKNDKTNFIRMYPDKACESKSTKILGAIKLLERLDTKYRQPYDVIEEEDLKNLSETQKKYVMKCAILVAHYNNLLSL